MIKKFLIIIFLLSISHQLLSQSPDFMKSKAAAQWADSILSTWTFEEKLGQLFTLEANSSWPQKDIDSLAAIVEKYNIGGLIFFKGGPLRQANQTNYYQRISKKVPMLISIDGEWGLSMRLDSTMRFPRQMTGHGCVWSFDRPAAYLPAGRTLVSMKTFWKPVLRASSKT